MSEFSDLGCLLLNLTLMLTDQVALKMQLVRLAADHQHEVVNQLLRIDLVKKTHYSASLC